MVQSRPEMQPAAADRSAHFADATLHQSSSAAQQHPQIHVGPQRTGATYRVTRQTREIYL